MVDLSEGTKLGGGDGGGGGSEWTIENGALIPVDSNPVGSESNPVPGTSHFESVNTATIVDSDDGTTYDVGDDLAGGGGDSFENRLSKVRQVGAAPVSNDWTKEASNPVVAKTESYESDGISEASVVEVGGTFVMLYGADDGTDLAINRATSPDGINWTKDSGNPVLSQTSTGNPVGQMSVAYADDEYHMYVRDATTDEIRHFTSPDSVSWTDNGVVLSPGASGDWDEAALYNTCVIKAGQTWYVWYEAQDSGGTFRIGLAVGNSPNSLTKFSEPVLEPSGTGFDSVAVYNPSVYYSDGMFYMWYGANGGSVAQTGLATSTDGVHWTRWGLALPVGPAGSWDDAQAMDPSVLRVGDTFYMWYKGADGMPSTNQQIGLATNDLRVPQ